jgi:hypothetical protein
VTRNFKKGCLAFATDDGIQELDECHTELWEPEQARQIVDEWQNGIDQHCLQMSNIEESIVTCCRRRK